MIHELVNLLLQKVGEEEAGLDGALAHAGGAGLIYVYFHDGSHALACDLHQSEFAQGQDVVAGPVALHILYHAFVEFLSVLGDVHINEVHDDDASHISQSQLACEFVGSSEVDFEGVSLLAVGVLGAVATIDVNDVERLGVLDADVGYMRVDHGLYD